MVELYAKLVMAGKREIESVPERYKLAVKLYITANTPTTE